MADKTNNTVSSTQMAAELGVPISWIYHQTMSSRGQGSIPVVKEGKHLRFNRDDVFNWIESKQNGGSVNG
jgi:hypothetical protein